jgi:hypothetical protein
VGNYVVDAVGEHDPKPVVERLDTLKQFARCAEERSKSVGGCMD